MGKPSNSSRDRRGTVGFLLGLGVSLAVAACTSPPDSPKATEQGSTTEAASAQAPTGIVEQPVEAPPAAAEGSSSRAPDEQERAAMIEVLSAESFPERKAWFVVAPGNPEAQALARALGETFERGGWKVESRTLSGMTLKPGVAILVAEEEPPAWTETAQRALEASGIEIKSAFGYRPYFEEMKRNNPAWPGIPLAADQAFVIAIGPEPKG